MECLNCKQIIPDGSKFCNHCGQRIEEHSRIICSNPQCGKEIPSDSRFCPFCGTEIKTIEIGSNIDSEISTPCIIENDAQEENSLYGVLQSLINDMVQVKGGSFIMGNENGIDTTPTHEVELRTYRISKYLINQEQWEAIMGWNPSEQIGSKLPVEHVSYEDCVEFIHKLNELTGLSFRLPTEAEWEYAARGGRRSQNYTYSGSNNSSIVAWTNNNSSNHTHEIGAFQPNELGLYDMSGNVSEWCEDVYDQNFYTKSKKFNPVNYDGEDSEEHVLRGGNINEDEYSCSVYVRQHDFYGDGYYGFRLAHNKKMDVNTEIVNDSVKKKSRAPSVQSIIENIGEDMIYVEGGEFTMGATKEQENESWDNEKPAHMVTISSFHICKHTVTIQEWEAIMGKCKYVTGDPNHPINGVSWDDCHVFINKLNELTGKEYRLPTEAEWEFAARGGNESNGYKYSGGDSIDDVAIYRDTQDGWIGWVDRVCDVMQKRPNELGLFDMSGNVWEWCEDWYAPYNIHHQYNPTGPKDGEYRVIRGGDADCAHGRCRVSSRDLRSEKANGVGFRLVY